MKNPKFELYTIYTFLYATVIPFIGVMLLAMFLPVLVPNYWLMAIWLIFFTYVLACFRIVNVHFYDDYIHVVYPTRFFKRKYNFEYNQLKWVGYAGGMSLSPSEIHLSVKKHVGINLDCTDYAMGVKILAFCKQRGVKVNLKHPKPN